MYRQSNDRHHYFRFNVRQAQVAGRKFLTVHLAAISNKILKYVHHINEAHDAQGCFVCSEFFLLVCQCNRRIVFVSSVFFLLLFIDISLLEVTHSVTHTNRSALLFCY